MKALKTLIKLRRQNLDSLRRQMGDLEHQKVQLLALIERIKGELQREIDLAQKSNEMSMFFGDYAKRIRAREAAIRQEIQGLENQMHVLREAIRDAFAELKKFETARDNRLRAEKRELEKQETGELDEIGGQHHQRNRQSENSEGG